MLHLLTGRISISVKDRWEHVFQCSRDYHKKASGFAEFCFRCSRWITSKIDWEAHWQDHIDNLDVPFRCDSVIFRRAIACAGYCSGCMGKKWLPAAARMKQFLDRTSWQRHISVCIPDYVKSLDSKNSIACPHLLCAAELHSESDLWNHLGDIRSTHKPDTGKKRQHQQADGEDEETKTLDVTLTKRPRFQEKLEDKNSKAFGGRKSAPKGRFKNPLARTFVNISAMDFDPEPIDVTEMSNDASSRRITPDDSFLDNHDDCYSVDTSLSSLSCDILESNPRTVEDFHYPWPTSSGATTVDLLGNSEPWHFDAITDAVSSSIEEDWVLSEPSTSPSDSSSVPMDLVDPTLQNARPFLASSLPLTTDSVKDAHGSTSTSTQEHIESTGTEPLCGTQGVGSQPTAIDAEGGIWEVEELLARWKRGRTSWYLVQWKGFLHGDNTWERRNDISSELVKEFEATYRGNFSGVRLLEKRGRSGRAEYLVEWKGRPQGENSWEKEATISHERIMEFEAS